MTYAEEIKNRIYAEYTVEPVKAAIYARVSTDNEGQKDSCANQEEMARRFIKNHPNISLVGVYVDDGISGKNDFTRPEYSRMVRDIADGKIELIIAKALSRLNRDEYNALGLANFLVEHDATVLTLEDNQLHDFEEMNSGLVHSLSYAIDAQYVKRQSISGHKTQELRCERKELSAKDISYGYSWDKQDKTILTNPEEAETVRYIFEEYVYRDTTPAEIRRKLADKGIVLSQATINHILQDTRYIGKFYINKQGSKLGTGKKATKRFNLPKEQWVLVERPDLQIIDTELFQLAQRLRESRQTRYGGNFPKGRIQAYYTGHHEFSQKIFCAECGKPYQHGYADRKQMIPIYRIHNHCGCYSSINRVNEQDLEEIVKNTLRKTIEAQDRVCEALENTLTTCLQMSRSTGETNALRKLRQQKSTKEKQVSNLITTLASEEFIESAKEHIRTEINRISEEISALDSSIREKETSRIDDSYIESEIKRIKQSIEELRQFRTINREQVENYVHKILVHADGSIDILLQSGTRMTIRKHEQSTTNRFPKEDGVGKTFRQDMTDPCRPDTQTVQRT